MRLAIAAALWLALAFAATAQTYSPRDLRGAALAALAKGDAASALAMAEALLDRDPGDETARAIRSRAARDLGRYATALGDARAAWAAADTDRQRYRASLLQAQALASRGNRLRAEFWLRRAADLAPTPAQRQVAIRDFRYVRSRNPLTLRLTFGIAPTDNVNNGSTADEVDYLGDIRRPIGTSRALSGTRYTFGADVDRRFRQTRNVEDSVVFGLRHQTYTLSDSARRLLDADLRRVEIDPETGEIETVRGAEGIDGGDFAYSAVRLGLRRKFTPGPGRGLYDLTFDLGRDWYGGDPYTSFAETGAGLTARIAARTTARLDLGLRYVDRDRGGGEDARRMSLGAEVARLTPVGRVSLSAGIATGDSDARFYDYDEARLGLRYAPAAPILGAEIALDAEMRVTDFGDWPFLLGAPASDERRRDVTLGAGIEAVLPALGRYGFAPVVTIDAIDRRSDAEIYDFDQIGIGISVRSVF